MKLENVLVGSIKRSKMSELIDYIKNFMQSRLRSNIKSKKEDSLIKKYNLLSIKEAAEYLGVSTKTLYTWRQKDKVPYVKIGGTIKYKKSDLDHFITKQ